MTLDLLTHVQTEEQLENRYSKLPYPKSQDRLDSLLRVPSNREMLFKNIFKDEKLPQLFVDMDVKEEKKISKDIQMLKKYYNSLAISRFFKRTMQVGNVLSVGYTAYCEAYDSEFFTQLTKAKKFFEDVKFHRLSTDTVYVEKV